MAAVACPFCGEQLVGGHVDLSSWGRGGGALTAIKFRPEGQRMGGTTLLRGFDSRPAGRCDACGAVVIAPDGRASQD